MRMQRTSALCKFMRCAGKGRLFQIGVGEKLREGAGIRVAC